MALCSVLISVPFALLVSLSWVFLKGGTFLQFLLVYSLAGQVGFILALAAFYFGDRLVRRQSGGHQLRSMHFDKAI